MIAHIQIRGRWVAFAAPQVPADDPAIAWLDLAGIQRHIPDLIPGKYPVKSGPFYGTLVIADDYTVSLIDHTFGDAPELPAA